jgi:mono/diheme cytochrome c family protein
VTEDRTGRELTPRPTEPEGVVEPRESSVPESATESLPERFSAGEQTHAVGLTEERAAQVVRQSSNARMVAFLAVLIFILFIPIYWLYDIGLPVLGIEGRLQKEADQQYVTDVSRGYALFLANCARCHGNNGEGGVGPPLNDQMKLYNALTPQGLPGTGHLNPNYLNNVLTVGGRYVCGNPNSVMPAWLNPAGPLNYRQVAELIAWITATSDTDFTYVPPHPEGGATQAPNVDVEGWRDPNFTPPPGSTPVPACWTDTGGGGPVATPAPITNPGTPENPRVINIEATADLHWIDPTSKQPITSVAVLQSETVTFHVTNPSTLAHNFHLGSSDELAAAPQENDLPGVDLPAGSTQDVPLTVNQLAAVSPQFACTVPGHYTTMHADIVLQQGGPAGSPGESPAAASPAASGAASPAPSAAAPSVASSPAPSALP